VAGRHSRCAVDDLHTVGGRRTTRVRSPRIIFGWAVQLMRGKRQGGSVAVRGKGCGLAEAPQKGREWEWRVKRRRMIPCARAPSMTTLKGL
jgi:hypothetical protein